jgi:hypothetical protein
VKRSLELGYVVASSRRGGVTLFLRCVRLFATAGNNCSTVRLVRACDKCDITFCHSAVVGVQY